jgi:hypothetical protein
MKSETRARPTLLALLLLAISVPVLFQAAPAGTVPEWAGAAISCAALLGALIVMWRGGALRARYIVLLIAAALVAAAAGALT